MVDKNSLLGEVNIRERGLGVKGFHHKILGSFEAFLAGMGEISGVEVERGASKIGRGSSAFLRLIRAQRFPLPRIPDLYDWR